MESSLRSAKADALLARGVELVCPASIEVSDDIAVERIAPGVRIHAGCRIRGASTSMGPGCVLGEEGPATVASCQLGHEVRLKGGFFSGATFLDGASMGGSAHIRPGTLLEEQANGGHAVGLKQTLFLPFVTAGSLINFCDALMAGGTDRKNHSEIGSSYIHFNYTPRQDKATPSLVGDVPRGVMLDQPPIFLGGQGGLVGPARIAFGTIIAAGVIFRGEAQEPGRLHLGGGRSGGARALPFDLKTYGPIGGLVGSNLAYIGNLLALRAWYREVRAGFMRGDAYREACWQGALAQLECMLDERVARLAALAEKVAESARRLARSAESPQGVLRQQEAFAAGWPRMADALHDLRVAKAGAEDAGALLDALHKDTGSADYLATMASLPVAARSAGTAWLQGIVDSVAAIWHPSS